MDNTITREEAVERYGDVECEFSQYDGTNAIFRRPWPTPCVTIKIHKVLAFVRVLTLRQVIDAKCVKPGGRIDFQIESHTEQHPIVRHIVFDSTADAGWEY
jgi:hypothetical protein